MRIEYDTSRDLMYIWFMEHEEKAAKTVTVTPGVHADIDKAGRLIGIELLDASEHVGEHMQIDLDLPMPRKVGAID